MCFRTYGLLALEIMPHTSCPLDHIKVCVTEWFVCLNCLPYITIWESVKCWLVYSLFIVRQIYLYCNVRDNGYNDILVKEMLFSSLNYWRNVTVAASFCGVCHMKLCDKTICLLGLLHYFPSSRRYKAYSLTGKDQILQAMGSWFWKEHSVSKKRKMSELCSSLKNCCLLQRRGKRHLPTKLISWYVNCTVWGKGKKQHTPGQRRESGCL